VPQKCRKQKCRKHTCPNSVKVSEAHGPQKRQKRTCPKSVGSARALKSVGRSNPNPNSTLILKYINFINKLEFYNNYCLFCYYNKLEFINHNTFTCKNNIKDLEYINNILLQKINIIYTKSFKNINIKKDNNNNNLNIKSLYIDPCCLLPISIYIYYRANYKDYNKKRCGLNNIIITILFIIFKFKQSKDIPFNLYN
jgi:hypothetical protein